MLTTTTASSATVLTPEKREMLLERWYRFLELWNARTPDVCSIDDDYDARVILEQLCRDLVDRRITVKQFLYRATNMDLCGSDALMYMSPEHADIDECWELGRKIDTLTALLRSDKNNKSADELKEMHQALTAMHDQRQQYKERWKDPKYLLSVD